METRKIDKLRWKDNKGAGEQAVSKKQLKQQDTECNVRSIELRATGSFSKLGRCNQGVRLPYSYSYFFFFLKPVM